MARNPPSSNNPSSPSSSSSSSTPSSTPSSAPPPSPKTSPPTTPPPPTFPTTNDLNFNPNPSAAVSVYPYDLPTRFTYGIIEQHSLTRGGRPTDDVSSLKYPSHQHMGEWYLFQDLLQSKSDQVGSPVVRVLDLEEADLFYVPFFSSLSLFVNTNRQTAGSGDWPSYNDGENPEALVEWLESQEYWKRNNGLRHLPDPTP